MSRDAARSLIGTVLRRLGLGGVIALMLSLPAIWLAWEAAEAHAQAALLADAGGARVQGALQDMFARFERATASLRAQDLQGDTVSLTGRLLRVEPNWRIRDPFVFLQGIRRGEILTRKGQQIAG